MSSQNMLGNYKWHQLRKRYKLWKFKRFINKLKKQNPTHFKWETTEYWTRDTKFGEPPTP